MKKAAPTVQVERGNFRKVCSMNINENTPKNNFSTAPVLTADYVTVLTVARAANKSVKRDETGKVTKKAGPPIVEATAVTVRVSTQADMIALQRDIGSQATKVLSLGFVPGTEPEADKQDGEPFKFISKKGMGKDLGIDPNTPEGLAAVLGWHEINGERCICRLKANMVPSSWCLFDIDAVRGMPDHLAKLDSDARIEALAEIIPGFADAGLVIVPSTTGRVLVDGVPMDATGEHYYLQMNDADDLERFGATLLQRTMLAGFGFMKPRHSTKEPDKVIGSSPWGIADPTTFSHERLVYDGSPTVKGKGLSVADANIEIIEGGRLDTGQLLDLTDEEASDYAEKTGQRVERESRTETVMGTDGQLTTRQVYHFGTVDECLLKMDTLIEMKAGSLTLGDYWKGEQGHLRCQTPFRDSTSENGYLSRHKDGTPFAYDNGLRCKYVLSAALIEKHRPEIYTIRLAALLKLIKDTKEKDTPVDKGPLLRAFAQMDFDSEVDRSLAEKAAADAIGKGCTVTAFRVDVAKEKNKREGKTGKRGLDAAAKAAIAEGCWPLDKPLPPEAFPFNNEGALLCHEDNYDSMLKAYGIDFGYDMILKKLLWSSKGLSAQTDNAELALYSRIKSLAALNGLPSGSDALQVFLPAIAELKQVNRVRDYLKGLEWDGKDRLEPLAQTLGSHDHEISLISLRRWLIQACAATDGAEIGREHNPSAHAVFEYVLVLLGDQGVGKTKGLANILPKALKPYLKESVVLNTSNKDSIKLAISCFVAELGELDATFRAADHVAFKAFMSREYDELRMPYAAKSSRFRRRTVFVGSVNEPEFLKDKTGARRFFPLSVEHGFPSWSEEEVDQVWAQAWALYARGEQWWPTAEEESLLSVNAEEFRAKSWAEQQLDKIYDWTLPPEDNTRHTASAIWGSLHGLPGMGERKMSPVELSDLGHALRRLWNENGAYKDHGNLVIDIDHSSTKVNATGGKNRGWLLPPKRGQANSKGASPVVIAPAQIQSGNAGAW
jgi:hypothetical protein